MRIMTILRFILITFVLLVLTIIVSAQIMTREEAAVIARVACDLIGLAGQPLIWQTTQELPTPVEISEYDYDLQDTLALMGYNPQPTLYPFPLMKALDVSLTPYDDLNYIYWCGDFMVAVNAYSGRVLMERQGESSKKDSILPEDQLESIARQIAQAFLGNKPWKWVIRSIPDNPYDCADFTASVFDPSSGAKLLDSVHISLTAAGELLTVEVYQREVTVSTEPLLTRDEAKELAESILRNLYPSDSEFKPLPPEEGVLTVFEDSTREQFLAWVFGYEISFKVEDYLTVHSNIVWIDAHTGEVLYRDIGIMMNETILKKQHHFERTLIRGQYGFKGNLLVFNRKPINLGQPWILRNGRVYLWIGYLPFFKIERQNSHFIVRERQLQLEDSLVQYDGKQYVALRTICNLAGIRLWWDNERKVPILRAEWIEPRRLLAQK
jgi:hypothetical protein